MVDHMKRQEKLNALKNCTKKKIAFWVLLIGVGLPCFVLGVAPSLFWGFVQLLGLLVSAGF